MTNIESSTNPSGAMQELPNVVDVAYGDLSHAYPTTQGSAGYQELVSVMAPVVEGGRPIEGLSVAVAGDRLGSSAVQAALSHNRTNPEESDLPLSLEQVSDPVVSHDQSLQSPSRQREDKRELALQLLQYSQELADGVIEVNPKAKEWREQFLRNKISELQVKLGSPGNDD